MEDLGEKILLACMICWRFSAEAHLYFWIHRKQPRQAMWIHANENCNKQTKVIADHKW